MRIEKNRNRYKDHDNRVTINISGKIFETVEETLQRYPTTILGNRNKRQHYFCHESKQYVFLRNKYCFGFILFLFQSNGILSCPNDIPVDSFAEECEFFEIPPIEIKRMRDKKEMWKYFEKNDDDNEECLVTDGFKRRHNQKQRTTTDIYKMASSIIIVISVLLDCIQTLEIYATDSTSIFKNPWLITELVLNSWFLIDFLARFFSSVSKLEFLQYTLNLVDGLAVIPYFLILCFPVSSAFQRLLNKMMRILRIFRLLRLSRHSKRLQIVAKISREWKSSELLLLLINLIILVIIGASGLYYLEGHRVQLDESNPFQSIPSSLWWSIVTLTTVGYGDVTPTTALGKLFGAVFMTVGVTTHMLPVLIVADMYAANYIKENTKMRN